MEATGYNLKRYLGIPQTGEYQSELQIRNEHNWIDHPRMERACKETGGFDNRTVVFISEPYGLNAEAIKEILDVCRDFNLDFFIDGASKHNPGSCSRIVMWSVEKRRENIRRVI